MAFEAIIERVRQIKADIIKNREAEVLKMALDGLALVKLRIQTKGQSADGPQFAPYVPSYAAERKKAGYQIGFVDYTRTGQFWASVRPQVETSNIFKTVVVIGATNARGSEILKGAEPKRGNLLQFSKDEIKLLEEMNQRRVAKYIKF